MARLKAETKYFEGLGRRKEAVARVRLTADNKRGFIIIGRSVEKYFPTEELRLTAHRVLATIVPSEKLSVSAKIAGGGVRAQAEALAHGLARALKKWRPEYQATLRAEKFLTRDARIKERRKFGLKKARKAPQWSKR